MLRQIKRVAQFWREYAGTQSVELIDDKCLRDFIPWRKTYYHGKAEEGSKFVPIVAEQPTPSPQPIRRVAVFPRVSPFVPPGIDFQIGGNFWAKHAFDVQK